MKRTKRCLCVLAALACMATGLAVPASASEPTEAEKYQIWETISVEELFQKKELGTLDLNKRYRLIGTVITIGMPNLSLGSYYMIMGNDANLLFPVRNSGEKHLNMEKMFLTATVQFDQNQDPFLSEAHSWTIEEPGNIPYTGDGDPKRPSTADLRRWTDNAGYEYAVENAYRRFFIKAENGSRLPEIEVGDWATFGKRTTIKEIQLFLEENKLPSEPAGICPNCHLPLEACICGAGSPIPVWRQYWIYGVIGLLGLLVLILVVVLLARRPVVPPPPPPLPTEKKTGQGSKETIVLVNNQPLTEAVFNKTVVLSPFALKVLQGGTSVGRLLELPQGEVVIGRKGGSAPQFIQLDMSDRPDKEVNCSRNYAKFTSRPGVDAVDVEVVTDSGNSVTVDGRTMTCKGDSSKAKLGSHVRLMPDWEFELVKRS